MYNLAILYKNEEKNIPEAKKWFLLTAEKGHIKAMYQLGNIYEIIE